jgi:prepilin-type N-terminal cleavage/methylation domain-containing protein
VSARVRRSARSRRAGFTLVELMVALVIAGIVILTIYTIANASAHTFQEQQRVGQLQIATRTAADRIRRDIERAGLQATPDSATERTCQLSPRRLVPVTIRDNDTGSRAALATYAAAGSNTTQADRLDLVGNFVTSDAYIVRSIDNGGVTVRLRTDWQGFRRTFSDVVADPAGNTFDNALFQQVFAPGRMLHLRTTAGGHIFTTVSAANVTGVGVNAQATITVTPAVQVGSICNPGFGEDALIAPIGEVSYYLSTTATDLPPVRDPAVTGPNTILVREERNMTSGLTLPNGRRSILEFAVHFDVDAVVDNAPLGNPPNLQQLNDAAAATAVQTTPSRVRTLIVEVAARTPIQDPDFPWVARAPGAPLSRFRVFSNRRGAARVRSSRIEVTLFNVIFRGI